MGGISLQELNLIEKLANFGLSPNQAKIYLSIIQNGTSAVTDISTATKLHREDIYRVLPKLEKKGLIMTKLGRPNLFSAVPLEDALNSLISTDLKNAREKAYALRAELKQLVKECKQKHREVEEQDSSFVVIKGNEAVANKGRELSAISGNNEGADGHDSEEMIFRFPQEFWRNEFLTHAQHGKLQRVLIGSTKRKEDIKKLIENTKPPKGRFIVRITEKKPYDDYMIIDHNKALVITQKDPFIVALYTNNRSVVRILEENFETQWNDQKTETLYEQ